MRPFSWAMLTALLTTSPLAAEQAEKTADPQILVFVNPVDDSCRVTDTCRVVVTVANSGREAVYVTGIDALTPSLYHTTGEKVPGQVVEEPGPPPAHYYMSLDGKRIFVVPVFKLEAQRGIAVVAGDPRKGYADLPAGSYLTGFPDFTLRVFSEDQLIVRDGTTEKLWVRADATPAARQKVHSRKASIRFTDGRAETKHVR